VCLTLVFTSFAFASQSIQVYVDGQKINFYNEPVIQGGTTLVEFRPIFQELNMQVDYDTFKHIVTGVGSGININLEVGNNLATVNGKKINLPSAPKIIGDHVFVPLRFIGEATGKNVIWDDSAKVINIGNGNNDEKSKVTVEQIKQQTQQENKLNENQQTQQQTSGSSVPNQSTQTQQTTKQKSAIDEYQQRQQELNQQRQEEYNRQQEAYQKFVKSRDSIQSKIDAIKSEGPIGYWSSEYDYNKELNEKQSERQQLQNRLSALSLDDSWEAKSQKSELNQDISELDQEIDEMRLKRSNQLRIENYEQQLEQLRSQYYGN